MGCLLVESFPGQQSHETKMSIIKARERLMRGVGQRTKYKINMKKKSSKVYMDWTISRDVGVKGT